MTSSRPARALRGLLAAVFSTFVALLSHVAGGGAVPALLGVLVPLVLASAVCVFLVGRRMSRARLSLQVIVSQLLFHTLFVLGGSSGHAVSSSTAPGSSLAGAGAGHAGHGGAPLLVADALPAQTGHDPAAMWLAHAIAAVITVVALYRGERVIRHLHGLASALVRVLVPLLPVAVTPPRPRPAAFSDATLPSTLGVFASTHALRGPPRPTFS